MLSREPQPPPARTGSWSDSALIPTHLRASHLVVPLVWGGAGVYLKQTETTRHAHSQMLLLQRSPVPTILDILPTPLPSAYSARGQAAHGDGPCRSWSWHWWSGRVRLSVSPRLASLAALRSCPKAETALLTSQLAWRAWEQLGMCVLGFLSLKFQWKMLCSCVCLSVHLPLESFPSRGTANYDDSDHPRTTPRDTTHTVV